MLTHANNEPCYLPSISQQNTYGVGFYSKTRYYHGILTRYYHGILTRYPEPCASQTAM
jgi:hypothetical protein